MSFSKQLALKQIIFALSIFIGLSFIFPNTQTNAQRRDHLTSEEIEIVRDVQSIDYRMLVFIKAIERRFMVLNGTEKLTKQQIKRNEKDLEKWGELPEGTKSQLFFDISRILDESISKLEDVAEREPKNELLPIALHLLSDRAKIFAPRLETFADNTNDRREIALLRTALRYCNEIIEASGKMPRPEEKQIKKRTKKIGY